MGCANCGKTMQVAPVEVRLNNNNYSNQVISNSSCEYTLDQLKTWAAKLKCFQQKGLYIQYQIRPQDLNKVYGDVLSSINYPTNLCYYKKQLDLAQSLIMIVIGSQQC